MVWKTVQGARRRGDAGAVRSSPRRNRARSRYLGTAAWRPHAGQWALPPACAAVTGISLPQTQGRRKAFIDGRLPCPKKRRSRQYLPFGGGILDQTPRRRKKKLASGPRQGHNPLPLGPPREPHRRLRLERDGPWVSFWYRPPSPRTVGWVRVPRTDRRPRPVGHPTCGRSGRPRIGCSPLSRPGRFQPAFPAFTGGISGAGLAHPLNHTVGFPKDALDDRGMRESPGGRECRSDRSPLAR